MLAIKSGEERARMAKAGVVANESDLPERVIDRKAADRHGRRDDAKKSKY